jgi:hypothetical protein
VDGVWIDHKSEKGEVTLCVLTHDSRIKESL